MSRSEHGAAPGASNPRADINGRGTASTAVSVPSGCDFCGASRAQWRYPCRSFAPTVNGLSWLRLAMRGAWYACATCHRLVERAQWAQLQRRCLTRYRRAHGPSTAVEAAAMAEQLAITWGGFRANRTGPAEAVTR